MLIIESYTYNRYIFQHLFFKNSTIKNSLRLYTLIKRECKIKNLIKKRFKFEQREKTKRKAQFI